MLEGLGQGAERRGREEVQATDLDVSVELAR